MINVPVQAVPNQTLTIALGNQNCQLNIYQTQYGLFMDVYVNNALIIAGVICQNLNRIIRDAYLGFIGDFFFFDTLTDANSNGSDPNYSGLGTQYFLIYLEASDLP